MKANATPIAPPTPTTLHIALCPQCGFPISGRSDASVVRSLATHLVGVHRPLTTALERAPKEPQPS